MSPLEAFLIAALTGVGSFAAWMTKRYIAHLETENTKLSEQAHRGTELAEKGADVAERV